MGGTLTRNIKDGLLPVAMQHACRLDIVGITAMAQEQAWVFDTAHRLRDTKFRHLKVPYAGLVMR